MLRDRKALLERDIAVLKKEAANTYLGIVIGGHCLTNPEYQDLKTRIANMEFDLECIKSLIDSGHK